MYNFLHISSYGNENKSRQLLYALLLFMTKEARRLILLSSVSVSMKQEYRGWKRTRANHGLYYEYLRNICEYFVVNVMLINEK